EEEGEAEYEDEEEDY
ncbi:hypothetical protein KIPB_008670, partial [Kipferlia bialata]